MFTDLADSHGKSAITRKLAVADEEVDWCTRDPNNAKQVMPLSAQQFSDICAKFVHKYAETSVAPEMRRNGYSGWSWIPHPVRSTLSFQESCLMHIDMACIWLYGSYNVCEIHGRYV
jgi:hypothetical protein